MDSMLMSVVAYLFIVAAIGFIVVVVMLFLAARRLYLLKDRVIKMFDGPRAALGNMRLTAKRVGMADSERLRQSVNRVGLSAKRVRDACRKISIAAESLDVDAIKVNVSHARETFSTTKSGFSLLGQIVDLLSTLNRQTREPRVD